MKKLKPCPFCGGRAIFKKYYQSVDGRDDHLPFVRCTGCSAIIIYSYAELDILARRFNFNGGYLSDNKELWDAMHDEVIDKWNKRVQ